MRISIAQQVADTISNAPPRVQSRVDPLDMNDVANAIGDLGAASHRAAGMVQLRYLFGFEDEEISVVMGVSTATVERTTYGESLAQQSPLPDTGRGGRGAGPPVAGSVK